MKIEIFDNKWKLNGGFSSIEEHKDSGYGGWVDGCVFTDHGIVKVYSDTKYTTLHFTYNGNLYYRSIKKSYSKRYLVTLAKSFSKEIIKKSRKALKVNFIK